MTTARGTMTIGQVGIDIPLTVPRTGRWNGDTLSLSGTIGDQSASAAVARVLRDQFHGLSAITGEVRPVTFGDTPELNGYYRLGRPSITSDGASFESGVFDMSIDLERVPSSAQVIQEMRLLGAGRTNSHSFTTVRRAWYSPGVNAFAVDDGTYTVNAPTRINRAGADGSMLVVVDNPSGTSLFDGSVRWRVAPTDHYLGGCGIVNAVAGGYYRVVGSHIRPDATTTWGIGNNLVAVLGSSTADVAEFYVLWNDGAAAGSLKTFRITKDSSFNDYGIGPTHVQIIRNGVEAAALRVWYGAANTPFPCYLDIAVRRGARHVEFNWHGTNAGNNANWGVRQTSTSAGTDHTSGIHASSADSDGNKWILSSPRTVTTDTTNGRFRTTSTANTFPFMIGAEMAGAGAGFDDYTSIVYQYMGALSTRQRAVVG